MYTDPEPCTRRLWALPLAAAGRMTGDAPSFGGLGDEAAAGDEVRASGDSDETVAAAAGLVLPSTAGACAHHELTSRVDRGVPVPIQGDHQRMRTRVCVDPSPTAASPDGCTLSGRSNCPREGMQLSSLAGIHMHNEDADNCRSPASKHCVVSQSSIDCLVAHRQDDAGTALLQRARSTSGEASSERICLLRVAGEVRRGACRHCACTEARTR